MILRSRSSQWLPSLSLSVFLLGHGTISPSVCAQQPNDSLSSPIQLEPLPPSERFILPRDRPLPLPNLTEETEDDLELPLTVPQEVELFPRPNDFPEGDEIAYVIEGVQFVGNTAFSDEELSALIASTLLERETITVSDIYQAAEQIGQLYQDQGYVTTGILPRVFLDNAGELSFVQDGQVLLQVVEGRLETIEVLGTQRLDEDYVRSRLALATQPPLNEDRLVDALQMLHDDPLIERVDAVLDGGVEVGTNSLSVQIEEADSFEVSTFADNQRSPNIGTFQQGIQVSEGNLLGLGDRLDITYRRTEGSDSAGVDYTLPLNPREGTLSLSYSYVNNRLISPSIELLDIRSTSNYLNLTWRQPLFRTPRQELAIGITGSYRQSQVVFGESIFGFSVGFPTPGSDADGRSQVTALRFFQEWVSRNSFEAAAVRSQFSVGLGSALGGTVNATGPDNRFISWRGQGQYQRRLSSGVLLSLRSDVQLAATSLLPAEQFGLGGQNTVRGYRQDLLLADNGAFASAEVWFPVTRVPAVEGVLYLTPFVDVGEVWNVDGEALAADSLASAGVGLRWQQANVTARLDWGIPLLEVAGNRRTWQENGFHFSLSITDL